MLIVDSINYNVINECIDIPYLKYFFFYFYDCLLPSSRLLRGEEELLFGREKKYFEKKN